MKFSSLQKALDSSVIVAADTCISAVTAPNYKMVGRLESSFARELNVTGCNSDTSRNKCSSASQLLLNQKQKEIRQRELEEEEDISLIRKVASVALRQQQKKENHNSSGTAEDCAKTSCKLSCILETMHRSDKNGGNREQSQQKRGTILSSTLSSHNKSKKTVKSVAKKKKFNSKHINKVK
jgi:hypothetical protein